jgi:cytochrome c oxidase subunit 4
MVFTAITVGIAFINLGVLNDVMALSIAVTKATLVVLYFMHVRYSSKLTLVFVLTSVLFLLILFAFIMSDFLTRGFVTQPSSW